MLRTLLALLAVASLGASSAGAQGSDFAPRIAFGEDPASSMTIVWNAPAGSRGHRIEWGTTPQLGIETKATQRDLGELEVWPVYAELTGLAPGTEYYYQLRTGDVRDKVRTFRTAPAATEGFAFLAWGDQSSPGAPEAAGDAPRRVTELARSQEAAFALVMGDLSYAGSEERWWNQYVQQVSVFAASRPFMTVPGNHDLEGFGPEGYRTRFRMPSEDDVRWYAFTYGNARFIGLDTESFCNSDDSTRGAAPFREDACPLGVNTQQIEFLRRELAQARANASISWIVVYHHFGVQSQGKHGSNALMREHWRPLYDAYDVDLVLQAHDHLYLRSKPLAAGRPDPNGTVYVVAGTGGANLYAHGAQQDWEQAFQDRAHGLVRIQVGNDRINGSFIGVDGAVLDSFVVERRPSKTHGLDKIVLVESVGPIVLAALLLASAWIRGRGR